MSVVNIVAAMSNMVGQAVELDEKGADLFKQLAEHLLSKGMGNEKSAAT